MLGLLSVPLLLLVVVLFWITFAMHDLLAKRGMTIIIGLVALVLFIFSACLLVDGLANIWGWFADVHESLEPVLKKTRMATPHRLIFLFTVYLWPLIEIVLGFGGGVVALASWTGRRDKSTFEGSKDG